MPTLDRNVIGMSDTYKPLSNTSKVEFQNISGIFSVLLQFTVLNVSSQT